MQISRRGHAGARDRSAQPLTFALRRGWLVQLERAIEQVGDREQGAVLVVRRAPAFEEAVRHLCQPAFQRVDEPGFADAGFAPEEHDARAALLHRCPLLEQRGELFAATHELCQAERRDRGHPIGCGGSTQDLIQHDGLHAARELLGSQRLDVEESFHQPVCVLGDDKVSGRSHSSCFIGQRSGDAGHGAMSRGISLVDSHDLSGVNAQPNAQGPTAKRGNGSAVRGIQGANARRDRQPGPHRPHGVVFVSRRQPEMNCETGVEHLSDVSVERLDGRFAQRLVVHQHVPELLGFELFDELRPVAELAGEHAQLASFPRGERGNGRRARRGQRRLGVPRLIGFPELGETGQPQLERTDLGDQVAHARIAGRRVFRECCEDDVAKVGRRAERGGLALLIRYISSLVSVQSNGNRAVIML